MGDNGDYEVPENVRDAIIDVLCGQALADHLGDVRDAERTLWRLLGAEPWGYEDEGYFEDSAWAHTRARLAKFNLPLPEYLRSDEDNGSSQEPRVDPELPS